MTGLDVWEVILRQSHRIWMPWPAEGFCLLKLIVWLPPVVPRARRYSQVRHHLHTGAWSNGSPDVIADQIPERLLPGYFSQHGYDTLGTGKLFHGGGLQFFDLAYETEQRWSPFSKAQVAYLDFEQATKGSDHPRHLVENVPKGRETILPLNGLPSERNRIPQQESRSTGDPWTLKMKPWEILESPTGPRVNWGAPERILFS